MKTARFDRFGPPEVLYIADAPIPAIKPTEMLVKVVASAATIADARLRGASYPPGFGLISKAMFGFTAPRRRVLGGSYSGIVEEVGAEVTAFKLGDAVCGMTGLAMGTYAEYVAIDPEGAVALKPDGVSHEDGAAVLFGGTSALHFVRDKAKVASGMKVLVNGASGAVGTNALQVASHAGAEVTGVCSGRNLELVQALGANRVIDYTVENPLELSERFDIVVDTIGNLPFDGAKRLVSEGGQLVLVAASLGNLLRAGKHVQAGPAPERKDHITELLALVESGALRVVIDQTYPLDDVVEAHRLIDSNRKRGNVVLQLS